MRGLPSPPPVNCTESDTNFTAWPWCSLRITNTSLTPNNFTYFIPVFGGYLSLVFTHPLSADHAICSHMVGACHWSNCDYPRGVGARWSAYLVIQAAGGFEVVNLFVHNLPKHNTISANTNIPFLLETDAMTQYPPPN